MEILVVFKNVGMRVGVSYELKKMGYDPLSMERIIPDAFFKNQIIICDDSITAKKLKLFGNKVILIADKPSVQFEEIPFIDIVRFTSNALKEKISIELEHV